MTPTTEQQRLSDTDWATKGDVARQYLTIRALFAPRPQLFSPQGPFRAIWRLAVPAEAWQSYLKAGALGKASQ